MRASTSSARSSPSTCSWRGRRRPRRGTPPSRAPPGRRLRQSAFDVGDPVAMCADQRRPCSRRAPRHPRGRRPRSRLLRLRRGRPRLTGAIVGETSLSRSGGQRQSRNWWWHQRETPGARIVGGSTPGQPRRNGVRHASGGRHAQESRSPRRALERRALEDRDLRVASARRRGGRRSDDRGTKQLTDAEQRERRDGAGRADARARRHSTGPPAARACSSSRETAAPAGRRSACADDVASTARARGPR